MPFTPAQQVAHRVKLKAKGVCVICHESPSRPKRTTCEPCVKHSNNSRRIRGRNRKDGECWDCSAPPLEGRARCGKHTLQKMGQHQRRRRRRIDSGRCSDCGGPKVGLYRTCPGCRDNSRLYRRFGTSELQMSFVTSR